SGGVRCGSTPATVWSLLLLPVSVVMDRVSAPSRVGEVVGPPRAAALPRAQGGADSVRQGQHPRGNGAGVGPDGPVDQGATSSTCVVYGGWAAGQAATSGVCLWSAGATSSGAGLRGLGSRTGVG